MENEIFDATRRLVTALRHGDPAAAGQLYAEGATVLAPGAAPLHGRADVEAYWRAGLDLGLSGLELERVRLEPVADAALELGRYVVSMRGSARAARPEHGSYLVLLTKTPGGTWQRAVEVYSPDEPTQARPDRGKEE